MLKRIHERAQRLYIAVAQRGEEVEGFRAATRILNKGLL